jgi:hypothetical protein
MKQSSIYAALRFTRAAILAGTAFAPGCLVTNPPTSHVVRSTRDFAIPRLSKWDPRETLAELRQLGLYPAAISSPLASLPSSIAAPVNK